MQIKIETPATLESQRTALMTEVVEIMKKFERSAARYAANVAKIRAKIRQIDKKLGA